MLANSSICLTLSQVRYLFKKFEDETFGARNGPSMWEHVEKMVASYNAKNADAGGKIVLELPTESGS